MTPAEDIARGEALADRDHAREQEFLAAQTEMDAAQDHYDDVCSHMGHTGDPHEAAARLVAAHARMQAAEVAMQQMPRQRDGGTG